MEWYNTALPCPLKRASAIHNPATDKTFTHYPSRLVMNRCLLRCLLAASSAASSVFSSLISRDLATDRPVWQTNGDLPMSREGAASLPAT